MEAVGLEYRGTVMEQEAFDKREARAKKYGDDGWGTVDLLLETMHGMNILSEDTWMEW